MTGPINPPMTLKRRYLFKLLTNITGFLAGFVTQAIVPRTLGPAAYGNFSYVANFFLQFTGLLNLNSSTAFFTKLSRRQDEKELVRFYGYVVAAVAAFVVVMTASVIGLGIHTVVWPGLLPWIVVCGAVWGILNFTGMIVSDMADAYGLTVYSEIIKTGVKLAGLAVISALYLTGRLSLPAYFGYQYLILVSVLLITAAMLRRNQRPFFAVAAMPRCRMQSYVREFGAFCAPLVVFLIAAAGEQMLDRWMLQRFAGSVNQGFYALAFQIGSICFLFTSALMPLLLREQSISYSEKDKERLRSLFSKSAWNLYAVTAYFCCFIAVEAPVVIRFFGGARYGGAVVPLLIMAFYPMHQMYGQLNGNFFFATERVREYRNIGLAMIIAGVPCSYFLMAPGHLAGAGLGAVGLAVKMVVIQMVGVNVQLWFNTRYLGQRYLPYVLHQAGIACGFTALALLVSRALPGSYFNHYLAGFAVRGMLYSVLIAIGILMWPSMVALSRSDIVRILKPLGLGNGNINS